MFCEEEILLSDWWGQRFSVLRAVVRCRHDGANGVSTEVQKLLLAFESVNFGWFKELSRNLVDFPNLSQRTGDFFDL